MTPRARAKAFCDAYGLRVPVLLAPMAGACPASLSIAVASAGGMGACGALLFQPAAIAAWAAEVRGATNGAFQMNLWIPDAPPVRDPDHEARLREFLSAWGPEVPETAADATPPDFDQQCEAILAAGPAVVSSIMGVYPPAFVTELKRRRIAWFANVTTVAEAREAEAAGADAIVAQGAEAGGHRGSFDPEAAERQMAGLFALLPQVVDAVRVPVIATGGIADGRGVAAALTLGASAAQVGTGFLRTPEAKLAPAWAGRLAVTAPEDTMPTRAFSGRLGRSVATDYARAVAAPGAPAPAPYPVQRALTQAMRDEAGRAGDGERMQMWAGQGARLASAEPAGALVTRMWAQASSLIQ